MREARSARRAFLISGISVSGLGAAVLASTAIGWGDSLHAQATEGAEITPVVATREEDADYVRPYGPRAPWNIPVHNLPRHEANDYYAWSLWNDAPSRPGNFNLTFESYTYPVYYAADATDWFPVSTTWANSRINFHWIPWNEDWEPAPGTDGQVIILDPPTGREWNLFQVQGFVEDTVLATNGSLVPGDYRTREVGFRPSRGAGIPYLAMLIRPEEIRAGVIQHALSLPIRNTSGEYYVAPATKLEGKREGEGIPEGMRFALDVSEEEILEWAETLPEGQTRRSGIIVARALRDYGWFVTDISGSAHFQFEANLTAGEEWRELGLAPQPHGDKLMPRDMLDGLMTPERIYVIAPSDQYPPELIAREFED
ncbi:MAG: hypothetical protein AAGJ74_12570 [Pseudomonadota bacterium]